MSKVYEFIRAFLSLLKNLDMTNKILWQITSRHALVTCFEKNGTWVEKVISPQVVNEGNADWVNEVSIFFRNQLKALKVPLAEPYLCTRLNGSAIQTSPYIGPDVEVLFKQGKGNIPLLENIISGMEGVLNQNDPVVGVDARLSNFCLGPQGVVYVDTFPPIVKWENELIVHFPNPTDPNILEQEFVRKFKALGILRRLRFSLLEQGVGFCERDLLSAVRNVMGRSFALDVESFFNTFLDKLEISDALEKISLQDPDGIREVAIKVMPPPGEQRSSFLRDVFDLSSNFYPHEISDEEKITIIRNLFSAVTV